MKCGKCGALISDVNSVCPGCGTPASELEMNNMLIKENNEEGVVVMPDVVSIEANGNDGTNNLVSPEVNVEPVVEVANVNMDAQVPSEPNVAVTPTEGVVDVVNPLPPVENITESVAVMPTVDSPVMQMPVSEPVTLESAVVNTPEVAVEPVASAMPEASMMAAESVGAVEAIPAVDVAPVAPVMPEVNVMANTESVVNPVMPVVETPASEPVVNEVPSPVVSENANPAPTMEENTIINSVVSEVNVTDTPSVTTTETPVSGAPVDNANGEGKKKKTGLFIVVGVVLAFAIMAVCAYVFVLSQPSYLYKTFASRIRESLVSSLNEEAKPAQVNLTFKTNLKSNDASMNAMYEKINNLYLETSIYADMTAQVMSLDLLTKYKGNSLIGLDALVDKETAYIKLDDLYDKYISMDLGQNIFEESDTSESEDVINVLDGFLLAFEDSVKNDYFTKEKVNVKLNGVDTQVKANTLILNQTNSEELVKSMSALLKENSKFVESYASLNSKTTEEVLAMLDDTDVTVENEIKFTIYIKGSKDLAGIAISEGDETYSVLMSDNNISVVYKTAESEAEILEVLINNDEYTVNMYSGENVYSFVVGLSVVENPTFTKPDVTNSVAYTQLGEQELGTIMMGIYSNPTIVEFTTDFQDIILMLEGMMSMLSFDSTDGYSDVEYIE